MLATQSPTQLATDFIKKNQTLVEASGKKVDEVQDYIVTALWLKRRVYVSKLGSPDQIINPVGNDEVFAKSPVGKLLTEIMNFLREVPAEKIVEADNFESEF